MKYLVIPELYTSGESIAIFKKLTAIPVFKSSQGPYMPGRRRTAVANDAVLACKTKASDALLLEAYADGAVDGV